MSTCRCRSAGATAPASKSPSPWRSRVRPRNPTLPRRGALCTSCRMRGSTAELSACNSPAHASSASSAPNRANLSNGLGFYGCRAALLWFDFASIWFAGPFQEELPVGVSFVQAAFARGLFERRLVIHLAGGNQLFHTRRQSRSRSAGNSQIAVGGRRDQQRHFSPRRFFSRPVNQFGQSSADKFFMNFCDFSGQASFPVSQEFPRVAESIPQA